MQMNKKIAAVTGGRGMTGELIVFNLIKEFVSGKTMMMVEWTEDLSRLFKEGQEVDFFRNKIELLQKVNYYLTNKEGIKWIDEKGYSRLINDNHEVNDRCETILEIYEQ